MSVQIIHPPSGSVPERGGERRVELTDAGEPSLGDGRMSFLEHLDELRKRLIASLAGLAAGCLVGTVSQDSRLAILSCRRLIPRARRSSSWFGLQTLQLAREALAEVEALRTTGPTDREVADVIERLVRDFATNSKQNGYWATQLSVSLRSLRERWLPASSAQ
jgi:hypothetical protein